MQAPGKLGRDPREGTVAEMSSASAGLSVPVCLHVVSLSETPAHLLSSQRLCEGSSVSVSAVQSVQRFQRQSSPVAARGDGLVCLLELADWLLRAGLAQGAWPASGPRPPRCLSDVSRALSLLLLIYFVSLLSCPSLCQALVTRGDGWRSWWHVRQLRRIARLCVPRPSTLQMRRAVCAAGVCV